MNTFRNIVSLILLLLCHTSFSQIKTFTLKSLGVIIGDLEACRATKNNIDVFIAHSSINFFTIKADVQTESIYQNGVLIKAVVNGIINGKTYKSQTIWEKDHYVIDCHTRKYDYVDTTLTTPIHWSAGKLYFMIPVKGEGVYTETYGKMGTLEEVKNNALKMTTPESRQIYYYNEDHTELLKIEVINNIKNFEMIPD